MRSAWTKAADRGALSGLFFGRAFMLLAIFALATLPASGQTTVAPNTNTILFSGQSPNTLNTAPVGGIILEGTAISQFTGRPVRHLWVGDSFAGPCRMDPEIDAPGPWDINESTCTYFVNSGGGAIPFGGEFQYDAARHMLYFADNNSASQGIIRIGFNPDGDNGQGTLDLTTAFTLGNTIQKVRKPPFLGGTGCPLLGTGTTPNGAALDPEGNLWVSFSDSGDILRFNSPATATEFGFGSCAQFEQLVATTPDGAASAGLAFIGHDLWSGDGTSPFVIPNADTTCLVPPFAACTVANGTVIPTLPQIAAPVVVVGDQFYPAVNGNNLYYSVADQVAWVGNVAAGASGQTLTLTYLNEAGINPPPNPALTAITGAGLDGTDPANLVLYTAEDPVILVNPLAIGGGRWWQTTQPIDPNGTPGAPLDAVAVAGDSQITLSWSPAQSAVPVTSYTVRNSFISTGSPLADITVTPSDPNGFPPTSILIPGLTNGVSYAFEVQAHNGPHDSPFSAQSNIATPPGFGVPSAPTNVIAQPGDTQAVVTWTVSASNGGKAILSYTVSVIANGVPTGITVTVPPPVFGSNTDSTLVGGLTNGTSYTFTVHATNIAGDSPESAPSAPITPSAANVPAPTFSMTGPTSESATPVQMSYTMTVTNPSKFPIGSANVTETLSPVPDNISLISRNGSGLVTVTLASAEQYAPNEQVTLAGVIDPSFNGTFTILNTPSNKTFTFSQAGAAATSSSGTSTLLPLGNIVSVQPGQGTCTSGGPGVVTFSCNIGFMDAGAVVRITFIVQMQNQTIKNSATLSATDVAGTALTQLNASVTTTAPAAAGGGSGPTTDLSLTGKAQHGSGNVNSTNAYTWTIQNKGADAPNVAFTQPIPKGISFQSVVPPAGTTCTAPPVNSQSGNVSCLTPTLVNGTSINITVNVKIAATGTTSSTGSVSFDGIEAKPGNEQFTVTIKGQ
ncbi:MAG TPA: fibronectin type III domain-containing protein [Candidatus Acidoferrales bacterium]|jgi:uncharacterized repeat protein (TIGR01451 family)|nr:fibronectin type III domain-containing protein [Candidatus Acidoferrales bacterium]